MAIIDIPTGSLPYVVVTELPSQGIENRIYGVPVDANSTICINYRWHNGEWEEVDLGSQVFGFLFADYQASVQETVSELEQFVADVKAGKKVATIKLTASSCPVNLVWCLWDVEAGAEIQHNVFTMTKSSSSKAYEVELIVKPGSYKFFNDNYILTQNGAEVQMDIADFGEYEIGTVSVEAKGGAK